MCPEPRFASGPAIAVSDETFGQARGKARAVEGIEAPIIDLSNDDDRSIRVGSGTLLASSEEVAK